MVKKIDKDGNLVDLTAEEEAERQARETAYIAKQEAKEAAKAQEATDKASGNQKMLDLGLSQAEVDALTK